jgi:hypothetical protein
VVLVERVMPMGMLVVICQTRFVRLTHLVISRFSLNRIRRNFEVAVVVRVVFN